MRSKGGQTSENNQKMGGGANLTFETEKQKKWKKYGHLMGH